MFLSTLCIFFAGWLNKFGLCLITINSSYSFRACFLRAVPSSSLAEFWRWRTAPWDVQRVTWQGIASEEPMAPSELGQALVHGLSKVTMLQIFWEIQRNLVCLVLLVGRRMHKIVLFTSPSRVVSVGPGSSFQALTGSWPTAQAIFSLGLGQVGQVKEGQDLSLPYTSHLDWLNWLDDSLLCFFESNSLLRGHAGLDFQEGEDAIVLLPWVWWFLSDAAL